MTRRGAERGIAKHASVCPAALHRGWDSHRLAVYFATVRGQYQFPSRAIVFHDGVVGKDRRRIFRIRSIA